MPGHAPETVPFDMSLDLPAPLLGSLRFRPGIEPVQPAGGKSKTIALTGADIALWLILLALYGRDGHDLTHRVRQLFISRPFGTQLTPTRMTDALTRLAHIEVWTGETWAPALVGSAMHPMEGSAPEWSFTIDTDLADPIGSGLQDRMLSVPTKQLRLLASRHSVCLWLHYLAWKAAPTMPDHWPAATVEAQGGISLDVPIEYVGEIIGYDGKLPWTKVEFLFVTENGAKPVTMRELARIGVDVEVTKRMSTIRKGVVGLRIRLGSFYGTLAGISSAMPDAEPRMRAARKKRVNNPAREDG